MLLWNQVAEFLGSDIESQRNHVILMERYFASRNATGFGFVWLQSFGVEPDLAAFGKGLANGMPIGVLVKEKYMKHFEEVFFHLHMEAGTLWLLLLLVLIILEKYNSSSMEIGINHIDNFSRLVHDKGEEWINVVYPLGNRSLLKIKEAKLISG